MSRTMTRWRGRAVALGAVTLIAGGCGSFWERGERVGVSDEVLRTQRTELASKAVDARAVQDGLGLEVRADHKCNQVEVHQVERTHRYDRQSRAAAWMIGIAAAGASLGGYGGYLMATADDRPERTPPGSSDLTRKQAQGMGAGLVAAGGIAVAAALVHWAIVAKKDKEREVLEEPGDVVAQDVACADPDPAVAVDVWMATRDGRQRIGSTDAEGSLSVNLTEVVPRASLVGATWDERAKVRVGGRTIGTLDLTPVRRWLAQKVWAEVDVDACASPQRSDDCNGVQAYLSAFPDGEQAEEADALLTAARAKLERIAEREEQERRAEAERQRRLEEERRAAAERERLEVERRRQEAEAARRAEEQRYQREIERRRRAEAERREKAARDAQQRRERAAARRKCKAECQASCGGNTECRQACVTTQCR